MAVFTDISAHAYRQHLSQVEEAYELSISHIAGMPEGSLDSKFKINARGLEGPLVLTIHETPDVSPAGKSSEEISLMLGYVNFLANHTDSSTDRHGRPVQMGIPKPLSAFPRTPAEAPFLILDFNEVSKCLSIVPFIEGKAYRNQPEELPDFEETRRAGRALAALFNLAQTFPEPNKFPEIDLASYLEKIIQISELPSSLESVGYVLSGLELRGKSAQSLAQNYIEEMVVSGQALIYDWKEFITPGSPFPQGLIHGDLFTDNTIFAEDDFLYLLDFGETGRGSLGLDIGIALTSWGSQFGLPHLGNVRSFLEGVDSVVPLSADVFPLIPALVQIGAYRWETFRIRRIISQDADQYDMRSPAEFQSLRRAWSKLERRFQTLSSVSDFD